jgi:hypothetical protein
VATIDKLIQQVTAANEAAAGQHIASHACSAWHAAGWLFAHSIVVQTRHVQQRRLCASRETAADMQSCPLLPVQVLRSRQEARGAHWLQLEQTTQAALHAGFASSATTSTAFDPCSIGRMKQQLHMDQVQQQTVFAAAAAAGSGGLEQVYDEPSSLGGNSSQLNLLNTCQRTVSGSLDDVHGLE